MSLIKTNICMSYPVKWDMYDIANNYVQNFIDALGTERFGRDFSVTLEGNVITLSAPTGFAAEWLYYLGASTKREDKEKNAGGFGEGFKIAALCTLRDLHLDVEMESRDWSLRVTQVAGTIAKKEVSLLAYEVTSRPEKEESVLRLSGEDDEVLRELFRRIERAKNDFFYEGNPLVGPALYVGKGVAIYESTVPPKDKIYSRGSLFARHQVRATFRLPLMFVHDTYERSGDDRDRRYYEWWDIKDCIMQIVGDIPPKAAYQVLCAMQAYWNNTVEKGIRGYRWYFLLRHLCYRCSLSREVIDLFHKEYPLLVALPDTLYEAHEKNLSFEWYRLNKKEGSRLVQSFFCTYLGFKNVCVLCEEAGGLETERNPSRQEKKKIQLLEAGARDLLGDLIGLSSYPTCTVITSKNSPLLGETSLKLIKGKKEKNAYGLKAVHESVRVCLMESVLKGGYYQALAVYGHELLHRYGGDESASFRKALCLMNQLLYEGWGRLVPYEEKWRAVEG